ncbi:MAG: hypothetical protein V1886_03040 [archaeon]
MKYTISKKADEKVESELEIIKRIIIKKLNPISIILFGGFGRGEGSFEIKNSRVIPLNDYDIYVVAKRNIPGDVLDKVGRECSNAIGRGGLEFAETYQGIYDKNKFFHVDLRCLVYSQLGKMRRINRTYELKHASTVIYGEDVRSRINDIEIPISESLRYLLNPACHLLLCMDSRRLKGKFRKDEKMFAMHHISKTYLACASSLLISAGKFSPTYTGTADSFKKEYGKKFPELAGRIDEAIKLKVMPREQEKDAVKKWIEARDDLAFCMGYIAKKHWNVKYNSLKALVEGIYKQVPYTYFTPYLPLGFLSKMAFPAQYLLNILYFMRTSQWKVLLSWRDAGLNIAMSSLMMLYAFNNKELCNYLYRRISSFSKPKSSKWEDLRAALLFAFDKYFSQKLI